MKPQHTFYAAHWGLLQISRQPVGNIRSTNMKSSLPTTFVLLERVQSENSTFPSDTIHSTPITDDNMLRGAYYAYCILKNKVATTTSTPTHSNTTYNNRPRIPSTIHTHTCTHTRARQHKTPPLSAHHISPRSISREYVGVASAASNHDSERALTIGERGYVSEFRVVVLALVYVLVCVCARTCVSVH